ncbi:MAG: hypothetical protein ACREF3_18050 [Acetobacteraceae bacterium]
MIDPRELLKDLTAPAPIAMEMATEVRTDGGLAFQILQAPAWTMPNGVAVVAQWECQLTRDRLLELRTFLAKPDAGTGLQPEAAIDAALRSIGVGHNLGVFVLEGISVLPRVRFMFAYAPQLRLDDRAVNRRIYRMLLNPAGPVEVQAVAALKYIRTMWKHGVNQTEGRWMMLSQTDPSNPEENPFISAGL